MRLVDPFLAAFAEELFDLVAAVGEGGGLGRGEFSYNGRRTEGRDGVDKGLSTLTTEALSCLC